MYTTINFRSKKALKDALAAGERVTVFEPGYGRAPRDGRVALEGPHFPEPHRWYASAELRDGIVVRVS